MHVKPPICGFVMPSIVIRSIPNEVRGGRAVFDIRAKSPGSRRDAGSASAALALDGQHLRDVSPHWGQEDSFQALRLSGTLDSSGKQQI